jgi:predicted nucleic acid-binding protein
MLTAVEGFVCNNYALVETYALLQNRLGMEAAGLFQSDILPIVRVEMIDEIMHRASLGSFISANRQRLSLVGCSSFQTMRALGLRRAFTCDAHFAEQGFEVIP